VNLHQIVSGSIAAVNPNVPATIRASTGSTTNPDGSASPGYAPPVAVIAQVQELTTEDLRQLDYLNVQGSDRSIYLNGSVQAVTRATQRGGDLVTLQDGSVYLTTHVFEQWPDWCRVAATLQDGS
jgi:hypothetical protein